MISKNMIHRTYSSGVANPRLASRMRLFARFHAAFFPLRFFFYQQPGSVVMLCLATHKLHYHVTVTLLENHDEALSSGGRHLLVLHLITAYLSSYREKAIKAL